MKMEEKRADATALMRWFVDQDLDIGESIEVFCWALTHALLLEGMYSYDITKPKQMKELQKQFVGINKVMHTSYFTNLEEHLKELRKSLEKRSTQ